VATRMGTTRRLAFSLAAIALAAVAVSQSALSGADFTAQSSNPGNSFQAASSFEKVRVASGTYTGNGGDNRQILGLAFQPDVVIVKGNNTQVAITRTSMMSGDASKPLSGATALSADRIQSLDSSGFTLGTNAQVNANGTAYYWIALKAASDELKLGTYNGNGTSQSITGLGFSPEYVITASVGADRAVQRFAGMSSTYRFDAATGQPTAITSLGADGFSVGSSTDANRNGTAYQYLAFNDTPGRVDTGSYNGNGLDNRDIGGIGFQPHYVIVRADDTVTARPGVHRPAALGGDSTLRFDANANLANAIQALQADGFQVGTDTGVNVNNVAYHHLAVRDGNAGACTSPGAATVQASADTYVDQGSPTSNFGTASNLFVRSNSSSANRRTLVRFNLPALPSGCSVRGAMLRLFSTAAVTGRTIAAYRAAASWTETGATWNNQPGTTGAAANSASGTGWRTWDVASHVQAMYSGANDGFVLRDQTENAAANPQQTYQAREGTTNGQDPELVITFG
jgi:hypothetical protein